ncbi:hypothetical protein IFO70_27715 [Phormidium tenue FACHB-886]|nr:hypothetical protein [Phormidium tenue FACHB-886]
MTSHSALIYTGLFDGEAIGCSLGATVTGHQQKRRLRIIPESIALAEF